MPVESRMNVQIIQTRGGGGEEKPTWFVLLRVGVVHVCSGQFRPTEQLGFTRLVFERCPFVQSLPGHL
jgi:hypothetical protein